MNKVSGKKSDFALLREDASRVIIGYGKKKIRNVDMYEWYEVYIPKKQKSSITFQDVRDAIEGDINAQTDEKILTGFEWTLLRGWKWNENGKKVDLTGQMVNVWLSAENQSNFSEAHNIAKNPPAGFFPVTFKVGEDENRNAVYDAFTSFEELDSFYLQCAAFKNAILNEGWARKDAIEWESYVALFKS